jgi:hypothetical protein
MSGIINKCKDLNEYREYTGVDDPFVNFIIIVILLLLYIVILLLLYSCFLVILKIF